MEGAETTVKCATRFCNRYAEHQNLCSLHHDRWLVGDRGVELERAVGAKSGLLATTTPNMTDLHWAAGFLEGEGHFAFNSGPIVSANQKGKETLVRLQKMFGGSIGKHATDGCYYWKRSGPYAVGIMMTLYSLMSTRRKEQIKDALTEWKNR